MEESLVIPNMRMHMQDIKVIQKYTNLKKAIEYVEKQESSLLIYADYIRECEHLDRNLKKKDILRPKKLQEEHRKTSAAVWIADNEETIKEFKTTASKFSKYNWNKGDLFIRVAKNPIELEDESNQLGHCVRTYVKKVTEGKTAIFFIRKTNQSQKSFYTLELNEKREILQCYGKFNCSKTPEIEEFLNEWQNWMNSNKNKRKVA